MSLVNPNYLGDSFGNYIVVQLSCLSDGKKHFLKKHTDKEDIDKQYLFTVGPGDCDLVISYPDGKEKRVRYKERILCMDGRLEHWLDALQLKGDDRFACVVYKVSDPRYTHPKPVDTKIQYVSKLFSIQKIFPLSVSYN